MSLAFLTNGSDGIQYRIHGILTGPGEAGEIPDRHADLPSY